MKELITLIRKAQIVYTLFDNPLMKGKIDAVVIEQSYCLKAILKSHYEYKGHSLIAVSFRIKK